MPVGSTLSNSIRQATHSANSLCARLVRTRFFIAIWIDQLVQNVMHVIRKNVGHISERQLSYDLGKKVVRVCPLVSLHRLDD
jgi:hypothetical protein